MGMASKHYNYTRKISKMPVVNSNKILV